MDSSAIERQLSDRFFNTRPKKLSAVGLVVVALVVAFIAWPRRITLEPPFPPGVYTRIEESSTITWYSGLPGVPVSKTFVWRKYYNVGLGDCCPGLRSQGEILAFLDTWLAGQGWVRWQEIGSPCAHLAEAHFLETGKDYVPYVRNGTTSLLGASAVCVGVWPTTATARDFWVLIATRTK